MTKVQKIIKYIAIAFAIFLVFQILSAVIWGLKIISGVHGLSNSDLTGEMERYVAEGEIAELHIDVAAVELIIKEGDEFAVETNSKKIKYEQKDDKLIIEEGNHNWWRINEVGRVLVSIPTENTLEKLELDLGAGVVEIKDVVVSKNTDIDGGAGSIDIENSEFTNLNLDMGVGKFVMSAKITGNSNFDFGVGSAKITLTGKGEDYRICLSKGIGSATLSGEAMQNETYYGNGANLIDMDGGVGSIDIDFEEAEDLEPENTYYSTELYDGYMEYLEGSNSYEMIVSKKGNVVTTAPESYDGDVPEQKKLLREVILADNVVYEDMVVTTVIKNEEEQSSFEYRKLTEAEVEAALDGSPGVGYIWYNDAQEIEKIVFYGENIVWE